MKRFLAVLRKPFRYPERRRARRLREGVAAMQAEPQDCLDCGTPMQGPFCHACGQKEGTLKRPFWTFFTEFFDYTLSSDSRFYRTLIALVLRPGYLTREYMNGRRTRFFPPVRLYIVISIAFFLLLALADVALIDLKLEPKEGEQTEEGTPADGEGTETPASGLTEKERQQVQEDLKEALGKAPVAPEAVATISEALAARAVNEDGDTNQVIIGDSQGNNGIPLPGLPYRLVIDMFVKVTDEPRIRLTPEEIATMLEKTQSDDFTRQALKGVAQAFGDPTAFNGLLNVWLPRALLVLMPIFALLLSLTHWGKGRNYVHQLVFALHFHSFLFLLMAALTAVVPLYGGEAGFSLFWWGTSLYIIVALKVGEMQGWLRSFLKAGFIWVTYFALLTSGILLAVFQGLRAY